ncbi:MAG: hypothetical protein GXN98_02005 [Euryarchaeota archaeon]|nr:hypothetical protein [Euryarchaeota archaeon]
MLEPKTEIRMVGHILEKGVIFELEKALRDVDVEVMHVEVSFAALKAGVEEKMPSIMRFYLVGPEEERGKALEIVRNLAEETGCRIEHVAERT